MVGSEGQSRQGASYQLVPATKVTFLSKRYRIVIALDLSPSLATVDPFSGKVLIDEMWERYVTLPPAPAPVPPAPCPSPFPFSLSLVKPAEVDCWTLAALLCRLWGHQLAV